MDHHEGRTPQTHRGPRPLSERPAQPAQMTMLTHRDDDGRVTHYEFRGDSEALEQQLELLIATLNTMGMTTSFPPPGLKTRQAAAALCLQAAGLINLQVSGGMHAPYSTLTAARTTLSNILRYLKEYREERQKDNNYDDETLVPGFTYFEFDWDALFASIRG